MDSLDIKKVYKKSAPFIGRVIRRYTGEGPHVDDIIQETFIVAFKKRFEYDKNLAAIDTWLYSIASNLCKMHLRSKKRFNLFKGKLSKEKFQQEPVVPDKNYEKKEAIIMVRNILQKLPFKQREVFVLFELEDRDCNEISAMINIPVGTVWTRLHHARKKFTKLIKREMEK